MKNRLSRMKVCIEDSVQGSAGTPYTKANDEWPQNGDLINSMCKAPAESRDHGSFRVESWSKYEYPY